MRFPVCWKFCPLENAPEARKERSCQSYSASHIALNSGPLVSPPNLSPPSLLKEKHLINGRTFKKNYILDRVNYILNFKYNPRAHETASIWARELIT